MARWGMAVAAVTLVAGAALVAGSSSVPPAAGPATSSKVVLRGGSRVGYVNLPRLHREYRKAAKRADELNAVRKEAHEKAEALRAKFQEVQRLLTGAPEDPKRKDDLSKELVA